MYFVAIFMAFVTVQGFEDTLILGQVTGI